MKYQGQILDGQMHGEGKLIYDNGEYYDGEWQRGTLFFLYFFHTHLHLSPFILYFQASVMVAVNTYMLMAPSTLVTGKMIAFKAKVLVGIQTVTSTLVNGTMVESTAKVLYT